MTLLLEGKTAIITGGNAGIGKAIAERFAKEGANIIILATNQERGEATVLHLQSLNPSIKAKFFKVNVSLTKEVDATVADILKEFPSIDILINNAGIVRDTLLMKMSEDDWDTVLNITPGKKIFN